MRHGFLPLIVFFMTAVAWAQAAGGSAQQLIFDVVAIHPSRPDATGGLVKPLPNGTGYTVENMTAKTMMAVMYRVPARQIEGGPDWFGTDRFDVEARADRGGYSIDELHTMFKNLLRDRFGLKTHMDTKEGPVYILTIDKVGMKMKDDGTVGDLNIPITPHGPGKWVGSKVPMLYLCWFLGQVSQSDPRPVIDQTGLKDVYGFQLSFQPDLPPGVSPDEFPPEVRELPVLRDAVQEQLGLVMKPAKGPIQYYIVDRLDRPSAN
jgi:uncharacterized protein (TIGR03435 family)